MDKAEAVQPHLKGTAVSTNTLCEVFRQCRLADMREKSEFASFRHLPGHRSFI